MIKVIINGDIYCAKEGCTIKQLAPQFDVFVRNGYGISADSLANDGDKIVAVEKGKIASQDVLREMLLARNGEEITNKLDKSCVCVCGLGGLGSNIAEMLARVGIGKLIIVDFDVVDPTNLNRQNYCINDIGEYKTQATINHIKAINPYIQVEAKNIYITEKNVLDIIENADVVVEAFDDPACKAELVNTVLKNTNKYCVASSGMAGYTSSNSIKTKKAMSRLYLTGDNLSEANEGNSLMSPRVSICAGHMANMVIRLLLGEYDV